VAVPNDTLWPIEPHTAAKHQILRKYLDAWLPILGKYSKRLLYIDGFAGPGEYMGGEPGSPVIALEAATAHSANISGEMIFLFVEERTDRVAHLNSRIAKLQLPAKFRVQVTQSTFAERATKVLSRMDADPQNVPPTFALIDPFGFAGIPYEIIKRFLVKDKCEVLINLMVDHINRFLTHPHDEVRAHITDAFGTEEALQMAFGSGNRAERLRDLYQQQLKKAAKFVRYFDMRDRDNRTIYYLFFASNNRLGHLKMKEAMWKVDRFGDFRFSDATNPDQTLLFDAPTTAPLADELSRTFRGTGQQSLQFIETYVEDNTAYLGRHMREALQQLETEGRLMVGEFKTDGKRRRAGSYPKTTLVTFA
jgi:three-Cys-motif partner protein